MNTNKVARAFSNRSNQVFCIFKKQQTHAAWMLSFFRKCQLYIVRFVKFQATVFTQFISVRYSF